MTSPDREREHLTLATQDGMHLDAVWTGPPDAPTACVLCHPHPEHGGSMHNPLLLTLEDAVCSRGGAVLRFDFRGVGRSTGWHSGGRDEVLDVAAAVGTVFDRAAGARLSLGGWSFGGGVSFAWVRAQARPRYPVDLRWFGVAPVLELGSESPSRAPSAGVDDETPRMAIVGSADPLVSTETLRSLLGPRAELVVLEGCDHFFAGACGVEAADHVAAFVTADIHA